MGPFGTRVAVFTEVARITGVRVMLEHEEPMLPLNAFAEVVMFSRKAPKHICYYKAKNHWVMRTFNEEGTPIEQIKVQLRDEA